MNEGDQWGGEVVTFMAPHKAGWLSKQTHSAFQSWHRQWFVLSGALFIDLGASVQCSAIRACLLKRTAALRVHLVLCHNPLK